MNISLKRIVPVLALLSAAALVLTPVVYAPAPITASLSWSTHNLLFAGQLNTATVSVVMDPDCPSGQTYTGTLTVTQPDGVNTATFTVTGVACGTSRTAVYPTDFTGPASTNEIGVYAATWAGTTSALVGGQHPSFKLQNNFTSRVFPPVVPEFPAPAMLVAAIGLALFVAMRKGRLLKV